MSARRRLPTAAALAFLVLWATPPGAGAEALRPEIGKPLQAATGALRKKDFGEARAELRKAEAVANRTPYEDSMVAEVEAAIAADSGDMPGAIKAYRAVIDSGVPDPAARIKMIEAVAVDYYGLKDYADSIAWAGRYFKEGGTDAAMRTVLVQSYYLSGDYHAAAGEEQGLVAADEQAGRTPLENELQLLANSYFQLKDAAGYLRADEQLVAYYPKKEHWSDLIHAVWTRPGFAGDRLALDVERLRLATGTLTKADQYMEMAELGLQAGVSGEAVRVLDRGYAAGVLGSGPDADRHRRLKELVARTAAEDQAKLPGLAKRAAGDAEGLVDAGCSYVAFGQREQGIALLQQGLSKGGLKYPEDARLHLALAYLDAGMKPQAQQAFRAVRGEDGTAELARLWLLYIDKGPGAKS